MLIAHHNPRTPPTDGFVLEDRHKAHKYKWPSIPEIASQEFGEPDQWSELSWQFMGFLYHREKSLIWGEMYTANTGVLHFLENEDFGLPFPVRSTKAVYFQHSHGFGSIWPRKTFGYRDPAITYHPLGLILNPIIYALPVWLVLMGVRWLLLAHRARKRERLGLCARCAYDLGELAACPECGFRDSGARTGEAPVPPG